MTVDRADSERSGDWRERWRAWRNRTLCSPTFQRWAASFPLTRPIARRRAKTLFDLCAGFVYSQILLACVRTDLFRHLLDGPRSVEQLSAHCQLPMAATHRLLAGAASLGLLDRCRDGRFALGAQGAALLGNPGIVEMIEHHSHLYADLQDPLRLLRGERSDTAVARYWSYASVDAPQALSGAAVAGYSQLMAASQPMIAREVLGAYRFDRHRCLLDVGGGEGVFIGQVAERYPHLQFQLFDLPAVAERARARFEAAAIGDRARAIGGNLWTDTLPTQADIVSLVRVIHDHDDDKALHILRQVRAALPPGGVLLLVEPMAGVSGAETVGDAYFGLYLWAMGSGRARTVRELETMLTQVGFRTIKHHRTRTPLITTVLSAQ